MYINVTKSCLPVLCLLMSLSLMAKDVKTTAAQGFKKPLCFVENKGQVFDEHNNRRNDIQYKLSTPGLGMYVGNGQLHYQFKSIEGKSPATSNISTYCMDVTLVGANPNATVIPAEKQDYYENYFLSGTESLNAITAHSFNKIIYKDVYPGIDWVLYVKDNNVEYDFVVRPGGNIHDINIRYDGAARLSLADDGSITAETPMGSVKEKRPYAYENQSGKAIASDFILNKNVVSFKTGDYRGTLTIDPYLLFSTYFGGTAEDVITSVKETTTGATIIGGYTASSGLGTAGAIKNTYVGAATYMGFVTKYSALGALMFTTYFGGTAAQTTECTAIALDNTGAGSPNIYLAGFTNSNSMPKTIGPAYSALNDGFAAKINNTGTTITWCTYYGGTQNDVINGIACDATNNVYITGQTASATGIATAGTYQTSLSGATDAFVAKLSGANGAVSWGTYYGGTADEEAFGIACDPSDNLIITGQTNSILKIATVGAYQTVLSGLNDAFIAKFNSTGTSLVWGTYFGGPGSEQGNGVVYDPVTTNIAVVGNTTSTSGIATAKAAQTIYGGGVQDAFVAYLNGSGTMSWSTYYGGLSLDYGQGICVDNTGNVAIAGGTFSSTGIASAVSFQNTIAGDYDAYLTKFTPRGQILWGTYFGGTLYDYANAVACDNTNQLTIAGYTTSIGTYGTGGLSTPGAAQPGFAGGTYDGFVTKFKVDSILQIAQPFTDTLICAGGTLNVNYVSNFSYPAGNILTVELSDNTGSFASPVAIGSAPSTILLTSGTVTCVVPLLTIPGTGYRIRISSSSPAYNSPDNFINIHVISSLPLTTASGNTPVCVGNTLTLNDVAPYIITSYSWTGPAGSGLGGTGFTSTLANPSNTGFSGSGVTLADAGTYSVTTTHNGCPDNTSFVNIVVNDVTPPTPTDSAGLINCFGSPIYLFANPDTAAVGLTYNWLYPSGATSSVQNPVIPSANYTDTGYFQVYDVLGGCQSGVSSVHVSVQPLIPVSIYVTASPGDTICAGKMVNFTISTVNEGYTPHYQWMSGAFTPIVGANSSIFSSSTLTDGETIFCVLSSSVTCPSPVNAASNIITMDVINNPPIAYISASPGEFVPAGTNVTLRSVIYNGGTGVTYQWKSNGVNIPGANSDTLAVPNVNSNDTISLEVVSTMDCATPDSTLSNVLIVGTNVGVVNVTPSLENIALYPNPNNGTFNIKGNIENVSSNILSIEVLNPIGQTVYKDNTTIQNNTFSKTIDLNNLAEGIYLLHLYNGEQSKTLRFTVSR